MKPYVPAPPPGAAAAAAVGRRGPRARPPRRPGHRRGRATADRDGRRLRTPEEWRDFWKTAYGPTIVAYRNIADDPERVAALDRDLAALAARYDRGTGTTVLDWEYLLLTARRA